MKIDGSDILVGLIENLEPPGEDLNDAVEFIGDDDKRVFTTFSGILVGLILNLPDDCSDAGDLAKEVSLTEASSAESINECDEPDGLSIPFKRGRSIELRLNPYNRKISAGFFGTESYTKSVSQGSIAVISEYVEKYRFSSCLHFEFTSSSSSSS